MRAADLEEGNLIVGNVFKQVEEWDAEREVGAYLEKRGH